MTTFDYARSQATADRLLQRFGRAGTLKRATVSGDSFNPVKGTPDSYPVVMVVMEFDRREIDGSRILQNDRKVYLSAKGLSIEPKASDELYDADDNRLSIIDIRPLKPAGVVVYYEIQCR